MQAQSRELRHIGLNAMFLLPGMGGMETYVRNLIPVLLELRPDLSFSLFADTPVREDFEREPWGQSIQFASSPLLGRRYTRAISEMTVLSHVATSQGVDLLHSMAMTGPMRFSATHVVTLPDLIWLHHPNSLSRVTTSLWRMIVPPIARRADSLITFSQASRDDIVRDIGVPESRIEVVPPGYGTPVAEPTPEPELRSRLGLGDGPIVLTASHKRPYKNLLRLIQALPALRERFPDVVLVMPGHPTGYEAVLREEAERTGVSERVRLWGWLEQPDLEGLYRSASCFVYPSLKEGFGLPILEAMRRDLPVACADASSLPEVAGDAALYFDPVDVESIVAAVTNLLADRELADRLRAAGRERCEMFTWRSAGERTLAAYEHAHADSRGRR
jgi:glycosyltransferase involved in cell wall biosynthesis